jgi:hypothetical protein
LVIETLRALAERRIQIDQKRLVDASGAAIAPFDLTEVIERSVSLASES